MKISDAAFDTANRRGVATKAAFPSVISVRYDRPSARLVVLLASELAMTFPRKRIKGLENARPADLEDAEISPSGLGIHFPRIDGDIYLPALLEDFMDARRWIAAQIGRIGGKASSEAKVTAARLNGKLGGRPKKPKSEMTL